MEQLDERLRARGALRVGAPEPRGEHHGTVLATVLGTLMAFALVRHSFRGTGCVEPGDLPADGDPRGGDGLLTAGDVRRGGLDSLLGFTTIVIAHVMFCLSFVVVTVKARLVGAGLHGWSRRRWTSTPTSGRRSAWSRCPWRCPGIVAAAMLAFSLSFDDFIVTNFTSGQSVTFPLFIYGGEAPGVPAPALRGRHVDVLRVVPLRHRRGALAAGADPRLSDQSRVPALSSTTRRICSISSKCSWVQISGGASCTTGSPRSSARQ